MINFDLIKKYKKGSFIDQDIQLAYGGMAFYFLFKRILDVYTIVNKIYRGLLAPAKLYELILALIQLNDILK